MCAKRQKTRCDKRPGNKGINSRRDSTPSTQRGEPPPCLRCKKLNIDDLQLAMLISETMTAAARRRGLQSRLQSPGGTGKAPEVDTIGCPACHATYALTRRQTPPGFKPTCENCAQEFLARDQLDWLVYEQVDCMSIARTLQDPAKSSNPSRDLVALYPRLHGFVESLRRLQARLDALIGMAPLLIRRLPSLKIHRGWLRKLWSGQPAE